MTPRLVAVTISGLRMHLIYSQGRAMALHGSMSPLAMSHQRSGPRMHHPVTLRQGCLRVFCKTGRRRPLIKRPSKLTASQRKRKKQVKQPMSCSKLKLVFSLCPLVLGLLLIPLLRIIINSFPSPNSSPYLSLLFYTFRYQDIPYRLQGVSPTDPEFEGRVLTGEGGMVLWGWGRGGRLLDKIDNLPMLT